MSTVSIYRCAGAAQFRDILALVHEAFGGLIPPSGAINETIDDVAARFNAGPILLAQDGSELVGSVFCATKGEGLYLTRMAVKPSVQKQGIGHTLLAAAEAEAHVLGLRMLTIRVRLNLPDNRAYFERAGFAVTGQGADPGRPPYLTMERSLRGAV